MILRQIKYFVTVVECRSFTEAAEQCYISQSAISQQVKALEQELGVELLRRENRSFTVTPAGQYLYKKGQEILSLVNTTQKELLRLADNSDKHLVIGIPMDYAGVGIYRAIDAFAERYPDISLDLIHGSYDELYAALQSDAADVIINESRRSMGEEYVEQFLVQVKSYIQLMVRNPLSKKGYADKEDLKKYPYILLCKQEYQYLTREYFRYCFGNDANYVFANSMEEGRVSMFTRKGVLPFYSEPSGLRQQFDNDNFRTLPLFDAGTQVVKNYCAYRKQNNNKKQLLLLIKLISMQLAVNGKTEK